jgi:ribosome recycling factor
VHGSESIKLLSPKLTNELRKKLVTQAKTQANLTIESIRQLRNEAHNTALRASGYGKDVQKRAADNVHEVFLHHKAEVDKVFRAKERSLQEEFNL